MSRRWASFCIAVGLVGSFWAAFEFRPAEKPPDISALERAVAAGVIENLTVDGNSISVWASDWKRAEPALRACGCEIRLMRGKEQVGTFNRRAGLRVSP